MTARLLVERFALEDKPGRGGGSAVIYKAVDLRNGSRPVAVKVFEAGRRMPERFVRESFNKELEALTSLRHPNVVELVDWGTDDGAGNPFVVLEWVERDLLDLLEKNPVEGWDSFAPIALGILQGLAAVHALGRAHRDVKPENILIDPDGTPKVADFGISKLQDRLNMSLTMGAFGTAPYRPPEEDDGQHTLARDVYAFGALVVRVLAGEALETRADVLARLDDKTIKIDVPPEVESFLQVALSEDPSDRPPSGDAALLQLRQIQSKREAAWAPRLEIYLDLLPSAAQSVAARLEIESRDAMDYVFDDIADVPAFTHAVDAVQDSDAPAGDDLHLWASSFRYRLRPHASRRGVFAVIGAAKLAPSTIETYRRRGWKGGVVFRRGTPLDPQRAEQSVQELLIAVAEHEQQRLEQEAAERDRELFRSWRALLDAKRQLEESRGLPFRYRSFRVEGQRVHFELTSPAPPEIVGEPRLVRFGRTIGVAGEVLDVIDDVVTLYVERGEPSRLRPTGQLEYDSEAAKFAIGRQEDALNAVRHGRAVRRDLGQLLLAPEATPIPEPAVVELFHSTALDDAKQKAVLAALGSPDFLLVHGPPGTGKTTFIAELIAQFLDRNPGKRVLVASQTHIALDNALDRIRRLAPDRRLLRVGRTEKIAPEVDELRLENQMEVWREEVLRGSRDFLRSYASSLGIRIPEVDVVGLATELRRVGQADHDLRSRIQNRQAERRHVLDELGELTALAPKVLDVASQVEQALQAAAAPGLQEAAEIFIEHGLGLAARLEGGGPLSERIVEYEQSLVTWRAELAEMVSDQERLRKELGGALGHGEDDLPSVDQLLEAAVAEDSVDHPGYQKLRAIYADWELKVGRSSQFNAALLARADVVAATCVGLAGVRGALDVTFDLCILDEASKATATEALVPMSRSRSWVLVGDPQQLPPFQEEALQDTQLLQKYELSASDLDQTLFDFLAERLPNLCSYALTHQYRMVPQIGELISTCFYDGELTSEPRDVDPVVAVALGGPVVWITTAESDARRERSSGTSFLNPLEAKVVSEVLGNLNFAAEASSRVLTAVVLTGYAAQREEILRAIASHVGTWSGLRVEVSTVDAFQGKEADIDIFSVTRSNSEGNLGFLALTRRINVAMSRGRDALVLVGDDQFCRAPTGSAAPMRDVLDYVSRSEGCAIRPWQP